MRTSTPKRLVLFLVLSLGINLPAPAKAQVDSNLLKLGAKVYDAIKKGKDGLGDLKKVEEVVKEIEAGRTPSVTSNQWTDLAKKYREAAKQIREAPLPTEFDKSKYAVSLDEFKIEVHEELVSVPIYGSIFQWDWFELNTDVSASLGDLTSALKAQKKKIDEEVGKLSLYIPNLQGNLSQLEGLS
jgi:hypothetical protein